MFKRMYEAKVGFLEGMVKGGLTPKKTSMLVGGYGYMYNFWTTTFSLYPGL